MTGLWLEVFKAETPDGPRTFYGNEIWVPDMEGDPSGDMIRQINIREQVSSHIDVHNCDDNGHVRFWIRRK